MSYTLSEHESKQLLKGAGIPVPDDALVENVEAHIAADHPDLVGKYSREQIVEMAHEH